MNIPFLRNLYPKQAPADPDLPEHLRPSFMIIGAQKAGTSALFDMLSTHPDVWAPAVKEQHFFDHADKVEKGIGEYLSAFPAAVPGARKVTFEATPVYLYVPEVPGRIRSFDPAMRFIVLLRDPVRRAYSAWNMFRSFKDSPLHGHLYDARSFEQAVDDELMGRPVPLAHRYVDRGYYAAQLARYFDLFGRSSVLVIDHVHLKDSPREVADACFQHVGLHAPDVHDERYALRSNVRAYTSPMPKHVEERLRTHYITHQQALVELLGPQWTLTE